MSKLPIEPESELVTENRRLRRELEDRDRIIQALLALRAGHARRPDFVWISKDEYLATPRRLRRDHGETGQRLFLIPDKEGYQGLGEFPEWARGLGFDR